MIPAGSVPTAACRPTRCCPDRSPPTRPDAPRSGRRAPASRPALELVGPFGRHRCGPGGCVGRAPRLQARSVAAIASASYADRGSNVTCATIFTQMTPVVRGPGQRRGSRSQETRTFSTSMRGLAEVGSGCGGDPLRGVGRPPRHGGGHGTPAGQRKTMPVPHCTAVRPAAKPRNSPCHPGNPIPPWPEGQGFLGGNPVNVCWSVRSCIAPSREVDLLPEVVVVGELRAECDGGAPASGEIAVHQRQFGGLEAVPPPTRHRCGPWPVRREVAPCCAPQCGQQEGVLLQGVGEAAVDGGAVCAGVAAVPAHALGGELATARRPRKPRGSGTRSRKRCRS